MDFLLEVGIDRLAPAIQSLGDQIDAGARGKGYRVLGTRTPETGAGIVSFQKPGLHSDAVVARLREQGITAAPRAGWVRTSPHFYVTAEEIERMIGVLP